MIKDKSNFLKIITTFSFVLLAAFPIMKENINSVAIIFCSLLTVIDRLVNKQPFTFNKSLLYLTFVFWMFFAHELISLDFSVKKILLHLPFLVFPLLFHFKPEYINYKIINKSIYVFQLSILVRCVYFLFVFLSENSIFQLFDVGNYNIPFFRHYVFHNASFQIHPTYFSAFLLVSFTLSYFILNNSGKKSKKLFGIQVLNGLFSAFFIFLLSSRMVIIVLFLTIVFMLFYFGRKQSRERIIALVGSFIILCCVGFYSFNDILTKRFNEVRTEINKPVKGLYYNSTNVRVAFYTCSFELAKKLPFFGYGDSLQSDLNKCYATNFDSDFYKKQNYNTHNYYLNLLLYGGWFFLILFLFYVFYVFIRIKHSTLAIVFLIQILMINFTENYFSRHFGIIPFAYFITIFIFLKKTKYFLK